MGVPRELAVCALRFSMGRTTTEAEVDEVAAAVGEAVRAVRAAGAGSVA
jgi:cysteine desulfurase